MQVLIIAAFFRPIRTPCAVVLAAQNLLARETVALAINLVLTLGACIFGLQWGLVGVAWALVATGILLAIHYYVLVRIALTSRLRDVGISIAPGLALSLLLAVVLAAVHHGYAAHFESTSPALYLVAMGSSGILTFAAGFCLLPFAALRSESRRWLGAARHLFQVVRGAAPLKP
jgi:O-antigen/teichoic acid export membrane protein